MDVSEPHTQVAVLTVADDDKQPSVIKNSKEESEQRHHSESTVAVLPYHHLSPTETHQQAARCTHGTSTQPQHNGVTKERI